MLLGWAVAGSWIPSKKTSYRVVSRASHYLSYNIDETTGGSREVIGSFSSLRNKILSQSTRNYLMSTG